MSNLYCIPKPPLMTPVQQAAVLIIGGVASYAVRAYVKAKLAKSVSK